MKPAQIELTQDRLVFCPNPYLLPGLLKTFAPASERRTFGGASLYFSKADTSKAKGISVTSTTAILGPCLGAPATALALEPYLANKNLEVLLVGTCGLLSGSQNPELFSYLSPNAVISDCSLSNKIILAGNEDYGEPAHIPLKTLESSGSSIKYGTFLCSDSPSLNTIKRLKSFGGFSESLIAVEMELAVTALLCRQHEIELRSIFLVTDAYSSNGETPHISGFNEPEFKPALKDFCQFSLSL